MVSNTTGNNQHEYCIWLDFDFRSLSKQQNLRKLEPQINHDFTVFSLDKRWRKPNGQLRMDNLFTPINVCFAFFINVHFAFFVLTLAQDSKN